ncbi:amino acid ABC transporter substrate-binding protein [Limibacillus halophilus]|uniref:Branched-chain amino acid transport system substrate-binding protein n=1 Tax=Limibacillus halophilus TaxID=1579333 RepID=A0A839SUU2_9PROT|nr:amino acid ABC transporter substrate-binding protein [Limibacillus halophilus]MBB3065484.1 branched-chain amino acid transport system substrate-binding protein [Limibacillus halophilus]
MLHFRKFAAATVAAAGLSIAVAGVAQADTIRLGSAISLTGKYSTNGAHTKNGYDLAAKLLNDAGGVMVGGVAHKIEIVYYDDESTPARGAQLAERLIQQDGVQFLLGPYSSGLTKAIAPVTENYGVPMVEANGASRSLFTQGYKYLFAVLSTSEQYLTSAIALAAEIAEKEGKKASDVTIAGAFENDPFSQDVRAGVLADAEKFGMKVVIDDKLPPELNDMSATLTKVKALKPDVLVVSGHSKGAALAIRQLSEMGVQVPMLAMTHCDAADIIGQFGAAAEGALCASQWAPSLSYSDDLFGSAADFAKLFEDTYGYAPPYQAAESAAAVQVFADAIGRAGTLEANAVRDALAVTEIQTFYGNIKFDETGKNIAKPMVLYQVQDGEFQVVAPTKWASAKLRYPR